MQRRNEQRWGKMTDWGKYSLNFAERSEESSIDDIRSKPQITPRSSSSNKAQQLKTALENLEMYVHFELGEMRALMTRLLTQVQEIEAGEDLKQNLSHSYLRLSSIDNELRAGLEQLSNELNTWSVPPPHSTDTIGDTPSTSVDAELARYLDDLDH